MAITLLHCITGIFALTDAQTYFFDNYSTQQEFESKVFTVIQDRDHYIWLGTPSGVWRFDGRTFKNYNEDYGISEGSVRVLFNDSRNTLWLGHEGGALTRLFRGKFEKITLLDSILRSNITSINEDKDHRLWITTESDGALVINNPGAPSGKLDFIHYLQGKSLGDRVFSSMLSRSGGLYFITNVGIRKFNEGKNTFEKYLPKGLYTYFSITVMFEDSRGDTWFGTYNGGLSKLSHKDSTLKYFDTRNGLASNWITSITEDKDGNIWVGHWKDELNAGGISRIESNGNITVFNTANGLHDDHIWCITPDFEGNLLIGTTDQGLEIFKGTRFVSLTTRDGLAHNQVNAITDGPGDEIWFGTNQGISIYDPTSTHPFSQFNQSNKFISDQINFFKKDRHGNIWIGTGDQGVTMYNRTQRHLVSQAGINENLSYLITALEISGDGHLWIGTIGALVEYDISNDRYISTYSQGSGLAGNEISALYADSKGDLWIGADKNKGVTVRHNGVFTILKRAGEITPTCFVEDNTGKMWIGTKAKGIFVLYNDSIANISTDDGLLSKTISMLYCDEQNNIYAGTNLGLNKIDQKRNKILSFTKNVGFTGIEAKPNAWCIDSRGFLWIGTSNGAMRCDLDLLSDGDTSKPETRLNEMLIKGHPVEMAAGLRLSYNQNDIRFQFSSISITNPEGIRYYTMLEGFDENWQDLKNENTRIYTKLPPGRYTFRVKARNEFGEWSTRPASYSFRILPPIYKRGYFIAAVILLLTGCIVAYIKIRERNLVNEKRILEAKVSERTQELSVANLELSMKNKDILDSITYAKRIQLAILPSEIQFENTFILYKPKDIVSGDFYWMNTSGGREFMAAVDCTGHGVPGAFMSFIGYTSLNKIIIEQGIYEPAKILDRLNEEVAATLHQKGESLVTDGMDIALLSFHPETGILEFAGAFNPLILVRNGEMIEIKADRFAIGRSIGNTKNFANNRLQIQKGDAVYMYSDGYADQFGGTEGKKFKTSALKELLIRISRLSTDQQQKTLDDTFENWKAGQEQIDDVLVMGRIF